MIEIVTDDLTTIRLNMTPEQIAEYAAAMRRYSQLVRESIARGDPSPIETESRICGVGDPWPPVSEDSKA